MNEFADSVLVGKEPRSGVQLPQEHKEHNVEACTTGRRDEGRPVYSVATIFKVPKDLDGWGLPPAGRI